MSDASTTPVPDGPSDQAMADYMSEIDRRLRQATWMVRFRIGAIQLSWVVVLIAGAAVSLVEALGWSGWIGAGLGFLVVVFQGLERIFGRTTEGSRSIDVFRRDLGREKRLYLTREGHYKDIDDPFSRFVQEAEKIIERNDDEEISYNAALTGQP